MTRGFSGDRNNAPEIIKKREKKPRPKDIYIFRISHSGDGNENMKFCPAIFSKTTAKTAIVRITSNDMIRFI